MAGFGAPGGAEDVGVLSPPALGTTAFAAAADVVSAVLRSLPFSVVDDGGGAADPLEAPFDDG